MKFVSDIICSMPQRIDWKSFEPSSILNPAVKEQALREFNLF